MGQIVLGKNFILAILISPSIYFIQVLDVKTGIMTKLPLVFPWGSTMMQITTKKALGIKFAKQVSCPAPFFIKNNGPNGIIFFSNQGRSKILYHVETAYSKKYQFEPLPGNR